MAGPGRGRRGRRPTGRVVRYRGDRAGDGMGRMPTLSFDGSSTTIAMSANPAGGWERTLDVDGRGRRRRGTIRGVWSGVTTSRSRVLRGGTGRAWFWAWAGGQGDKPSPRVSLWRLLRQVGSAMSVWLERMRSGRRLVETTGCQSRFRVPAPPSGRHRWPCSRRSAAARGDGARQGRTAPPGRADRRASGAMSPSWTACVGAPADAPLDRNPPRPAAPPYRPRRGRHQRRGPPRTWGRVWGAVEGQMGVGGGSASGAGSGLGGCRGSIGSGGGGARRGCGAGRALVSGSRWWGGRFGGTGEDGRWAAPEGLTGS